jgi:regulator of sigma E protease
MIILSILAFLILFSVLIVVHEAGHFFAAKKSGVFVEEFGLGMGKKLFGKKIGETEFTLNLIPFGGFVKMLGEDENSKNPRSFSKAKIWQKMIITLSGVFMNFVFTIVSLSILFSIGTTPILISEADLKNAEIEGLASFEKDQDGKIKLIELKEIKKPILQSIGFATTESFRISGAILSKIIEIPGTIIREKKIPDGLGGPIAIAEITHKITPLGFFALLKLAALLSLSLAVINLLPIPALDGGRFFFQLIELILKPFKIKINEQLESAINLSGFVLLMLLLLVVTLNDIMRLFL